MHYKKTLTLVSAVMFALSSLIIGSISLPTKAYAIITSAEGDDAVIAARRAYDKKDVYGVNTQLQQLESQGHILAPYADYWYMMLQFDLANKSSLNADLSATSNQAVSNFIAKYSDYPFTDKVRGEWLKALGKRQDWDTFFSELPNFKRDDAAVSCYAEDAHLKGLSHSGAYTPIDATVDDVAQTKNAKSLWLVATDQPLNCNQLFDDMQQAGQLTDNDIWARFRLAAQAGKNNTIKSIIKRTSTFTTAQLKLIDSAYTSPTTFINKGMGDLNTREGREISLYALDRLMRNSSASAQSAYYSIQSMLPNEDRAYFYSQLAIQAAQRLEPAALNWFKKANVRTMDKDQLAWYVRTALRQNDWSSVITAVNAMNTDQLKEGAWRYWRARAMKAIGNPQQLAEANKALAALSSERHFYGWLAQDELGGAFSIPPINYKPSAQEVSTIANQPAVQRCEALQRVDLRNEAKAEWVWATRSFDDKQLLAAAEYASRNQWYDLSIASADNATTLLDYTLRYPTPYREYMKASANSQGVDEAWVYGITRQESRFMHYAKSGVGAAGLMQLMPTTAKWAAKRAGIAYSSSMIHDLDTNVKLGTYYLDYTLNLMGGQAVMATAAYNAGPGRAKKWLASTPLEGAIYAESIPFNETRAYVQKVMANAHIYSFRLGQTPIGLKQRLGTMPSSGDAMNTSNINDNSIEADINNSNEP